MEHFLEFGLSIATAGATGIIGYLVYKLQKHEEQKDKAKEIRRKKTVEIELQRQNEYNALRASLLALTRDRILQGYRYFKRKGSVSAQDLETMNKLYAAYHALGGNGTITAIYDKIVEMPLKEE